MSIFITSTSLILYLENKVSKVIARTSDFSSPSGPTILLLPPRLLTETIFSSCQIALLTTVIFSVGLFCIFWLSRCRLFGSGSTAYTLILLSVHLFLLKPSTKMLTAPMFAPMSTKTPL